MLGAVKKLKTAIEYKRAKLQIASVFVGRVVKVAGFESVPLVFKLFFINLCA